MSKINNNDVKPVAPVGPTEILAANINSKFNDLTTATVAIDSTNVRSEGIDWRQLNGSPIKKGFAYRFNNWNDGTTNVFTIGTGLGGDLKDNMPSNIPAVVLNYSKAGGASDIRYSDTNPLVLNQGDLLRLHYSYVVESYETDAVVAAFPVGTNDKTGLIFFPTYWSTPNSTPNSIANAIVFPGRVNFLDYGTLDPASIPQTDPPSASSSDPEKLLDDGICWMDLAGEEIVVGNEVFLRRRLHGCLNYIHKDATPLTIYRIAVCTTGIMRLTHLTAPGFDTRCFLQAHADITPVYPFDIRMERGNIGAIVLYKGWRQ